MCTLQKFKLTFYVPPAALSACKAAVFAAGAGHFPGTAGYSESCFTTKGVRQTRAGGGGGLDAVEVGKLEESEEFKVEVVCLGREIMGDAVAALLRAHPDEEPAYDVYKMEDI